MGWEKGVGSEFLDLEILEDVTLAVTGMLTGATMQVYINDIAITRATLLADLTAPTYAGNGVEAITWDAPTRADDGQIEIQGTVGEFRPTDAVTPNDAWTWGLLDAAGALLDKGRFATAPLGLQSALDSIKLAVRFRPSTMRAEVQVLS